MTPRRALCGFALLAQTPFASALRAAHRTALPKTPRAAASLPIEMPAPPRSWADQALSENEGAASALESAFLLDDGPPARSRAAPRPVDFEIASTLANRTATTLATSAFFGCGLCGAVVGWCALSSLATLGGLAGAVGGALLVLTQPAPPPGAGGWLDDDDWGSLAGGDLARRLGVLWARACAAAVLGLGARCGFWAKSAGASLSRRYGPALEGVAGEIVRFDPVALQQQTAAVAASVGSAVADAATEVDRRFQLGGKLRSLAQQTVALVAPPKPDAPHYRSNYVETRRTGVGTPLYDRPAAPQVSLSPLRRVSKLAVDAGRRARHAVFGAAPPPPEAPPPRAAGPDLASALLASIPALLLVLADHRDELVAAAAAAARVANAAAAAAALEAADAAATAAAAAPAAVAALPT